MRSSRIILAALAAFSIATVFLSTPADARRHYARAIVPAGSYAPNDSGRMVYVPEAGSPTRTGRRTTHARSRAASHRTAPRAATVASKIAPTATGGFPIDDAEGSSEGSSPVVTEARRWIGSGGSIVHRGNLWCAAFLNFALKRAGYRPSPSNYAGSFNSYGPHVPGPRVGAIAVMRGLGPTGHVGIVSAIAKDGNPIIISGNTWRGARPASGGHVMEAKYPRSQVLAYVMPKPTVALLATPGDLAIYEDENGEADQPSAKTEFDRALLIAAAEAKEYLIKTAHPAPTMIRQGFEEAIGNFHPVFALRLAVSVKEARASGLPNVGVKSGFRAPELGVGGFRNKYDSSHTFGLAGDMDGIGRPNSSDAKKWHKIAKSHGLFNPYFGGHKWFEWNHYQAVSIKIMPKGGFRKTVGPGGPEDRERMWRAADPFLGSIGSDLATWNARQTAGAM